MMDWAELNPDLLRLISKKLSDISNFVRFRVVCKNWRLSVGPRDCPPQLPWFTEYRPSGSKDSSDRKFFSLYSSRTHTLHIPEAKGKAIFGTINRYFFIDDYSGLSFSLLNPLTGSHFPIPEIEEYTTCCPIYIGQNGENGGVVVVYMCKEQGGPLFLVFRRFADGQLTKIVEVEVSFIASISYFQGRLLVLDRKTSKTRVFDVNTGDGVLIIPTSGIRFDYLIEGCGDLLGVVKKSMRGEQQFEVYRLEDGGMDSRWVKMTSGIGDRMLFLDGYSLSHGLCLKASDFEGFKGNSIYHTTWSKCDCCFNLSRYDLESKETQVLSRSGCFTAGLFMPSLY